MLREKAMQYQADMSTTPTYLNEDPKSLKLFAKITFYITCLQLQKTIVFRLILLFCMQPTDQVIFFQSKQSFPKATILRVANDKMPT